MRVLVVAAHPGDEVIGCGGTMAKMAESGHEVWPVLIDCSSEKLAEAAKIGGWKKPHMIDHNLKGIVSLASTWHAEQLMVELSNLIRQWPPRLALIPASTDADLLRRVAADAACASLFTAARKVCSIRAYETSAAGYQRHQFRPDHYEILSPKFWGIKKKILLTVYADRLSTWPEPESLQGIEHLSRTRGSTVSSSCAEAFETIREVR